MKKNKNIDRKTKFLIALAAAVLALVAAVASRYLGFWTPKKLGRLPSREVTKPVNLVQEVPVGEDLLGFPSSEALPMPKSAVLIKSYRAIAPDGRVQVTKILESPKVLMENFDYFKSLLSDEVYGWTIILEVNESTNPNHKSLFAQNQNGILNVNIAGDQASGQTTIDLSFLLK